MESFAPTAVEYSPESHRIHPDDVETPEIDAYDPTMQGKQSFFDIDPSILVYVPGPHKRQPEDD